MTPLNALAVIVPELVLRKLPMVPTPA